MTRFLTFLAALLVAGAASATTLFVNAPNDGFLNLRSGPSTGYTVLDQMPHGSRVEVLSTPGKWYRIRHETGEVGWASSSYLARWADLDHAPRHDEIQAQRLYVDAPNYSGLNLREGPGTGHAVLLTMPQGSWVELLGRQGEWRLLRHESGRVGWAHGGYLSDTQPRAPRYEPPQQETPHWWRDEDPRADWRDDNRRDRYDDRRAYKKDKDKGQKKDKAKGHKKAKGKGHKKAKGKGHYHDEADRQAYEERRARERERQIWADRRDRLAQDPTERKRDRQDVHGIQIDPRYLPQIMLNCAGRGDENIAGCIASAIARNPEMFGR